MTMTMTMTHQHGVAKERFAGLVGVEMRKGSVSAESKFQYLKSV